MLSRKSLGMFSGSKNYSIDGYRRFVAITILRFLFSASVECPLFPKL